METRSQEGKRPLREKGHHLIVGGRMVDTPGRSDISRGGRINETKRLVGSEATSVAGSLSGGRAGEAVSGEKYVRRTGGVINARKEHRREKELRREDRKKTKCQPFFEKKGEAFSGRELYEVGL